MKILRFNDDRVGVLDGDKVIDISELISHREYRGPQGVMDELIGNFSSYRPKIEKLISKGSDLTLSNVKLLVPLPHPGRVMAAFVNYVDRPERPAETLVQEFFHKSAYPVGPGGSIELPDIKEIMVFQAEAELAFVVGKNVRHISPDASMDTIFGYLPFFDISARGLTRRSQLLPKGQETFAACGPWITTSDEISDPHDLIVKSWVNGEARQNYNTKHMAYKIPAQISWLSRFIQLRPCDIVATGVFHAGMGPINVGDFLEIEIGGLGRTGFRISGDSPKKDMEFHTGKTAGPPMKLTRV